jgi:hypothetical protein
MKEENGEGKNILSEMKLPDWHAEQVDKGEERTGIGREAKKKSEKRIWKNIL